MSVILNDAHVGKNCNIKAESLNDTRPINLFLQQKNYDLLSIKYFLKAVLFLLFNFLLAIVVIVEIGLL